MKFVYNKALDTKTILCTPFAHRKGRGAKSPTGSASLLYVKNCNLVSSFRGLFGFSSTTNKFVADLKRLPAPSPSFVNFYRYYDVDHHHHHDTLPAGQFWVSRFSTFAFLLILLQKRQRSDTFTRNVTMSNVVLCSSDRHIQYTVTVSLYLCTLVMLTNVYAYGEEGTSFQASNWSCY